MAGTYSGGYHGTGDFEFTATTGAEIARNHAILQANADRNRALAGGQGSHGVQKKVVKPDKPKKPKKPKKPSGGTGPGNAVVGDAPGTGPGNAVVGGAPTAGPGLGVITPNLPDESGVLAPVGVGPGNVVTGVVGTLTTGPASQFVGPVGVVGASGKGDGEQRTSIQVFGPWTQPVETLSDAEVFETRYGDDGPLSWGYQIAVGASDTYRTFIQPEVAKVGPSWGRAGAWALERLTENQRWAWENDDSAPVPGSWDYERRKAR